jgi:enoyl-CoA hydratase/carnithine racemase
VGIADTYYSQMLARLIGPVRTRDLMFTGRTLSAQEALEWGMMARVVPHDELADTAREVHAQCCRTAPGARAVIKSSLGAPESIERFPAFKERRSRDWVHPGLRVEGRL